MTRVLRYRKEPRLLFRGALLLLDGRELGEFRASRFEPTALGERLGLAGTLGSKRGALDYVLGRMAGRLTVADVRFTRVYFATTAGRRRR